MYNFEMKIMCEIDKHAHLKTELLWVLTKQNVDEYRIHLVKNRNRPAFNSNL
jgi:L-rhamnose mutarotase